MVAAKCAATMGFGAQSRWDWGGLESLLPREPPAYVKDCADTGAIGASTAAAGLGRNVSWLSNIKPGDHGPLPWIGSVAKLLFTIKLLP